MKNFLHISSDDNTDILVFVKKIQFVKQEDKGCSIWFDNGCCVKTGAKFEHILGAICNGR